MANAYHDDNAVPTLIAASSTDGSTPVRVYADPTTHRLLVDMAASSGTVTSVSVVSANGFAGTVANSTTTPAITLSTTITGVLKGNGTAISAAVSGTDYAPATSGSAILKGNGTGGFSSASAGTDYVAPGAVTTSGLTQSTGKLLGRGTAATGAIEEITLGTNLSLSGTTLNAASVTPGGLNTQVQFNDGGSFGGDADFTWNKTTNTMTLGGSADVLFSTNGLIHSANATGTSDGTNLELDSGAGSTSGNGGNLVFNAGSGVGAGKHGGHIVLTSGSGTGGATAGQHYLYSGANTVAAILDASSIATSNKTFTFPNTTGTIALTANTLGDFAATTSAQLAGVISDETGSGLLVFATNPTLSGATFADATNIVLNATTGTKIGTATTQKLAFYNSTPIVQPTGDVVTALQNLGLVASATIASATNINTATEATDTTCFPVFVTASGTQTLPAKTNTTLTYNSNTNDLGVTKINGLTMTASTGTFTLTNAKTLSVSNSLTLAGTDSTTMTFPTTSATIARTDAAQTFTGTQTFSQIVTTVNAITASGNAATVPITSRINNVTNNSAATLTITMTTTSAVDGQLSMVRIFDFSAVAQTITWVNTENSTVSAPTTSNGSTTLPLTVGFQYNSATSKWRCIAKA